MRGALRRESWLVFGPIEPFEHRTRRIGQPVQQQAGKQHSPRSRSRARSRRRNVSHGVAHSAHGKRRKNSRNAGEEENDASGGAVLCFRHATDAFRIDSRVDHGHEQAGQRGAEIPPVHAPCKAEGEAQPESRRSAPRGRPGHRSRISIHAPRKRPAARSAKKIEMLYAASVMSPSRVARQQRRQPDVNRRLDADVEKGAARTPARTVFHGGHGPA